MPKEHRAHIKVVFKPIKKVHISAHPSKFTWGVSEVSDLGYLLSSARVCPVKVKVKEIIAKRVLIHGRVSKLSRVWRVQEQNGVSRLNTS